MKLLFITTILAFISFYSRSQTPEGFGIEIEPLTITNAPGVHSFSFGLTDEEKIVILGGRVDGLHRRQPWAAFQEQDNNKMVYVIDPVAEQVWSSDLSVLSTELFEQLQSTNQNYQQRDSMLYIIGGYGFSSTANDHVTYPYLTAVSLNQLADAVINQNAITPYFRQIVDTNLKVTGGQLGLLDNTFYLVGGQLFDGAYNPMGPDHGPGFVQEYSNSIRTFEINDDGTNLSISNYQTQVDTINLHRRDYNMTMQIFPDGTKGFTAWSGVFDYNDMPYLNSVDITPAGYTVNNTFSQYLSQYHSAHMAVHDANANAMHSFFFGGMSQFKVDTSGNLVEDTDVPFVNTISKVTRFSDGSMTENYLGYVQMPTLVGAGAEFIPVRQWFDDEMLLINTIPSTKTLVGYVYGGIESSDENIFFVNDGTQSWASNVIFKVFINKGLADISENELNDHSILKLKTYPNPADNKIHFEFFGTKQGEYEIGVVDMNGKIVKSKTVEVHTPGKFESQLNVSKLSKGTYTLRITNGVHTDQTTFIKQ